MKPTHPQICDPSCTSSAAGGGGRSRMSLSEYARRGSGDSAVSIRVIRALFDEAESRGAPRGELLRAAGLAEEELGPGDVRVSRATANRVCEAVITVTGDPAFGLHWAERLTEGSFPPLTNLFVHSTSLRDAFESLGRFSKLLSDEARFEVAEASNQVVVKRVDSIAGPLPVRRLRSEMFTVGLLNQVRRVAPHALPTSVSFAYPAPSYRSEYTRLFDGREIFNQPFTGVAFHSALLERRSRQHDAEMQKVLQALAERRLLRIKRCTPYSERVRQALMQDVWPQQMDMESVARRLRMSVRSLRRRLAAEKVPFGSLVNETLASVAIDMLCEEGRTIQQVSDAMGFADRSTFHRAFKRWTGCTPNEYRLSLIERM